MLALLFALAFSSPALPPPPRCRWWSRTERRCRDSDMEILGEWDPRPTADDWPTSYYSTPADYGAYPTEKHE